MGLLPFLFSWSFCSFLLFFWSYTLRVDRAIWWGLSSLFNIFFSDRGWLRSMITIVFPLLEMLNTVAPLLSRPFRFKRCRCSFHPPTWEEWVRRHAICELFYWGILFRKYKDSDILSGLSLLAGERLGNRGTKRYIQGRQHVNKVYR